ncbi:MAG: hypothetical protein P8J27_05920, partial [Mariniblastus sp.]|nr:hypothetical protein [Mariniblastus sp.]
MSSESLPFSPKAQITASDLAKRCRSGGMFPGVFDHLQVQYRPPAMHCFPLKGKAMRLFVSLFKTFDDQPDYLTMGSRISDGNS